MPRGTFFTLILRDLNDRIEAENRIRSLTPEQERRLAAYAWPGNVRELRNVVERAVITSRDGYLDLERALPEVAPVAAVVGAGSDAGPRIHTEQELQALERDNIDSAYLA